MNIERQVCTLEQAKRLKELGISINDSLFVYVDNLALKKIEGIKLTSDTYCKKHFKKIKDAPFIKFYSAFTVAELGIMLGNEALKMHPSQSCTNEAIERADDLICLLEYGELLIESINERLLS